jgi:hypothetical protein
MRKKGRGHVCTTYNWGVLATITFQLGLADVYRPDQNLSVNEINAILERDRTVLFTNSPEEARYVATFIRDRRNYTTGQVCGVIRARLGQLGLLAVR